MIRAGWGSAAEPVVLGLQQLGGIDPADTQGGSLRGGNSSQRVVEISTRRQRACGLVV